MFAQLAQMSSRTRRRIRLLASLATAGALLVIGWHLLVVLIPLAISAIAAALLMPLVTLGERSPVARRSPRANRLVMAITTTLLAVMIVLAVLGLAMYALVGGAKTFIEEVLAVAEENAGGFEQLGAAYREMVPPPVQEVLNPRLVEYRDSLVNSGFSALERVASLLQSNISQMIAIIATPIAIFQMLYQPRALTSALRDLVPGPLREDLTEMARRAGRTVVAYIRVQLSSAIFVGGLIWLLYWAVGIKLALPLGMLAAMTELVPIIGSTIFLLVSAAVVALTDLQKLPLVIAFFLLVQVVHGGIVFPRFQGQAIGLHPVILVVALAVFSVFFGILGALVAAPVTGAIYRVVQYAAEVWNYGETTGMTGAGEEA